MKIQLRTLALPFGLEKLTGKPPTCPDGQCVPQASMPDLLTKIREKRKELHELEKQYSDQNPFAGALSCPFIAFDPAHTKAVGYRKIFISHNGQKPFVREDFIQFPSPTAPEKAPQP